MTFGADNVVKVPILIAPINGREASVDEKRERILKMSEKKRETKRKKMKRFWEQKRKTKP